MRLLSGHQPSGKLHLGNYYGAMKQHIDYQNQHEGFYFIANYHALTTIQDAGRLRQLTSDVAMDYLTMGLDPNKATLFRQSDVPEVTELAWLLATVTGKGLMDRATSYKDKVEKGIAASLGLFVYPALMAADILIYRSNLVPVGKDQLQHIEFAQDMAGYFNNKYGEVFVRPEPLLSKSPYVPGVDGLKMSKSYGNTIDIFMPANEAKKRIMGIKTDSTPVDQPKTPETTFALIQLLADPAETAQWEQRYKAGGMGYGDAKKRLVELYESYFGQRRAEREKWAARADEVEDILRTGEKKARAIAQQVMDEARAACGIVTAKAP